MISKTFALALVMFGAAVSASATELVTNGTFEATPLGSGWTLDSSGDYTADEVYGDWNDVYGDPLPKTTSAWLGGYDEAVDTISQSISTAGYSHATLTMDVLSDGFDLDNPGDPFDYLTVSFGGVQLAKYDVGSEDGNFFNVPISLDLTPYLDGTSKTLAITVTTDDFPDSGTSVFIDNVSISAQPVPEPATMAVLGFGALAVVRRRRR